MSMAAGPARPVYLLNEVGQVIASAQESTLQSLLTEFRSRYDVVDTASQTVSSPGATTIVAAAPGTSLVAVWFYAQAAGALGTGVVRVRFDLGTNAYEVELTGSQPFAHSAVWEGGDGDDLTVTLSRSAEVLVNIDYRII